MSYSFTIVLFKLILPLPFIAMYQVHSKKLLLKKGISTPLLHIVGIYLFCILLACILTITGVTTINEIDVQNSINPSQINLIPFVYGDMFGLITNMVMFLPFGFLLPMLFVAYNKLHKTVLAGFLFSLAIECSQLFNYRSTDIDDLIMNTLGAFVGFLLYQLIFLKIPQHAAKWRLPQDALRHEALIYIVIVFVSNFFLNPIPYLLYQFTYLLYQ